MNNMQRKDYCFSPLIKKNIYFIGEVIHPRFSKVIYISKIKKDISNLSKKELKELNLSIDPDECFRDFLYGFFHLILCLVHMLDKITNKNIKSKDTERVFINKVSFKIDSLTDFCIEIYLI